MEVKRITLKQLLENSPEEIEIPGYGPVLVRFPTIRERLEVKDDLKKLPGYKNLSEEERSLEEARLLALKMLVDPKIKLEDYLEAPDASMLIILDTVSMWYTLKLKALNDKRKSLIDHFLQQMKEQ
ncbi:MAG: hypothetical protein DRI61_00675 [Chloroflexi bacterium]|nr:MAG: hypothetical protein DRI61_00675 [Chloroflexota bacterium]